MIGCDEAETAGLDLRTGTVSLAPNHVADASGAHLMDPLLAQAGNEQGVSVASGANGDGGSSSAAVTCQTCSPAKREKGEGRCKHTKKWAIYKLTSPAGKSYVGQAQCLVCRMSRYKWGQFGTGRSSIAGAIRKYGWDNMHKEVLECGLKEEDMDAREIALIAEHNTLVPNGYNIREGGGRHSGFTRSSGPPVRGPRSEQTKQRISAAREAKREEVLSGMDPVDADRVRMALQRDREHQAKRRSGERGLNGGQVRRAATWEAKREAKWEEMGMTEIEKAAARAKVARQAEARKRYREGHPEVTLKNKDYMDKNRKRFNDARPRLTGNLRA